MDLLQIATVVHTSRFSIPENPMEGFTMSSGNILPDDFYLEVSAKFEPSKLNQTKFV